MLLEGELAHLLGDLVDRALSRLLAVTAAELNKAHVQILLDSRRAFKEYLVRASERVTHIKTLLHRDAPRYLYTLYVPADVSARQETITDAGVHDLMRHSSRILITGFAGSGKSTFLRHLFLDAIRIGERIPVFIELRHLRSRTSLEDHILSHLTQFGFTLDKAAFLRACDLGTFVFLFDGADEASGNAPYHIESFLDLYSRNQAIMTSRPDSTLYSLHSFTAFKILPLTKAKAIRLIHQLDYDAEIVVRFVDALDKSLFTQHSDFASVPLLLIIMLMTYDVSRDIPVRRHLFYASAFDALWYKHDVSAKGFRRPHHSSLMQDEFLKVISCVAMQAFLDSRSSFSETDLRRYLNGASTILSLAFDPKEVMQDMLVTINVLFEDGLEYCFCHRTFQEYFTALYLVTNVHVLNDGLVHWLVLRAGTDLVLRFVQDLSFAVFADKVVLPWVEKYVVGVFKDAQQSEIGMVRLAKEWFSGIIVHVEKKAEGVSAGQFLIELPEAQAMGRTNALMQICDEGFRPPEKVDILIYVDADEVFAELWQGETGSIKKLGRSEFSENEERIRSVLGHNDIKESIRPWVAAVVKTAKGLKGRRERELLAEHHMLEIKGLVKRSDATR